MAKLQRSLQKQNLENVRVLIDDTDPFSRFFRIKEIRDVLHGGRQGFLIQGAKELVNETEVLIEILDINGDPIFLTTVRNFAEGRARFVSIEVYPSTPVGAATLTILGEAASFANGSEIPDVWKGVFNVKWQKSLTVDSLRTNDSKIRVFEIPTLVVKEVLTPFRKTVTSSFLSVTGSGGQANANTAIVNTSVNIPNTYTVTTPNTSISKSMEGGSFTASIDGVTGLAPGVAPTVFSSSIVKVSNDSTFEIDPPLISDDGTRFSPFKNVTNYTISFQEPPAFSNTTLSRSFADVELARLKTFSGDIARTKFFVRSAESEATFELVGDIRLESLELTVTNSAEFGPKTRMGNFFTQSVIDAFWVGGNITSSNQPPYTTFLSSIITPARDTAKLIDSMHLSTPNLALPTGSGPTYFMGLTGSAFTPQGTVNDVTLDFIKGLEYSFAADVLCRKEIDTFAGKMDVYLSGSAFPSTSSLGTLIASYDCPVGEISRINRKASSITNFIAKFTGTAKLFLVIHQGDWHVSDLSIFSSKETGFNPDCASFLIPVFNKRFEQLQFKAQLFDPNNNEFPEEIFSDFVFFDGGNVLFRGTDNRIEGTLTIAPSGSAAVILSSEGYLDEDSTPISGSVMAITNESIPTFNSPETPWFVATNTVGEPKISISDKLKGEIDPVTGEFILTIIGTILVGSGSSFVDIRSLLPRNPSDTFFHRARGINLDMFDLQGKKAITAGNVQSDSEANFIQSEQIARMGKYVRGTTPRSVPATSPLIVSGLTGSLDPFSAVTVTAAISSSGTILIPDTNMIWNNSLYGNMTIDLQEVLLGAGAGAYEVDFELTVDTSWVGFESGSNPGLGSEDLNLGGTRVVQTITIDDSFFITQTGSFSPDPFISYPIHIPEQRPVGFDTLYVVVKFSISTTQS